MTVVQCCVTDSVLQVCPRPEGACCFEGELCNSMTQQGCKDRSGHYFGDNTKCDDVECEKTVYITDVIGAFGYLTIPS